MSKTQTDQILEFLESGQKLTPLEALEKFGCFRLGARIFDIKARGRTIHSKIVNGPNGKKYSQYWIEIPKQLELYSG